MKKILVVGSINNDITLHMEKLPVGGETVIASNMTASLGGKGANQAVAASRMGGEVSFIGAIGQEQNADNIIDLLLENKVDVSGIKRVNTSTGAAYISIEESAENTIIVHPGANFKITKEHLYENKQLFEEADYCLLQLEIPMEITKEAISLCKQNDVKIVLNPAPYNSKLDKQILSNIDYFIPNQNEFIQTINKDLSLSEDYDLAWYKEKGNKFVDEFDLTLIITLGSQGALIINERTKHIKAQKVKAVDTTAAGDSFIGGFLAALSSGKSEYEALDFGARVAAITISRYGAIFAIPYKDEVV